MIMYQSSAYSLSLFGYHRLANVLVEFYATTSPKITRKEKPCASVCIANSVSIW
jgi:hypothetical protein